MMKIKRHKRKENNSNGELNKKVWKKICFDNMNI